MEGVQRGEERRSDQLTAEMGRGKGGQRRVPNKDVDVGAEEKEEEKTRRRRRRRRTE
jgi:hypothetical protein